MSVYYLYKNLTLTDIFYINNNNNKCINIIGFITSATKLIQTLKRL